MSPVKIKNFEFRELSGISLYNRNIFLFREQKKIRLTIGEILFTHQGLSGPGILDFSRYIQANDVIKISLVDCDYDMLTGKIVRDIKTFGKKSIKII